jgi:hypothetical protein
MLFDNCIRINTDQFARAQRPCTTTSKQRGDITVQVKNKGPIFANLTLHVLEMPQLVSCVYSYDRWYGHLHTGAP